jgi:hypothetical protein
MAVRSHGDTATTGDICPLYGRCGRATEKCATAMPGLCEISSGRFAACHYPIAEPVADTHKLAAIA